LGRRRIGNSFLWWKFLWDRHGTDHWAVYADMELLQLRNFVLCLLAWCPQFLDTDGVREVANLYLLPMVLCGYSTAFELLTVVCVSLMPFERASLAF